LRRSELIDERSPSAAFILKALEALTKKPAQAASGFSCQALCELQLRRGQRYGNGLRGSRNVFVLVTTEYDSLFSLPCAANTLACDAHSIRCGRDNRRLSGSASG
jgi:hypothetical protein